MKRKCHSLPTHMRTMSTAVCSVAKAKTKKTIGNHEEDHQQHQQDAETGDMSVFSASLASHSMHSSACGVPRAAAGLQSGKLQTLMDFFGVCQAVPIATPTESLMRRHQ